MMKKWIAVFMLATMVAACAEQGGPLTKQQVGTILGGVGGAVLGSNVGKGKGNVAAIALGTLAGAAMGNSMGASLDRADQQYHVRASQQALETLPSGQSTEWRNPDSGHSGVITPTRTYQQSGQYCREYTQALYIGGKRHEGYGKACRQPDGTWRIVE